LGSKKIVISNPAHLKIKNSNLCVVQDNTEYIVPTEDIGMLILEDKGITLSNSVLSVFAENNVSILSCNSSHLPVSLSLPFQNHSHQFKRLIQQINMTEPFKKQLWQSIIIVKVLNQATCLEGIGKADSSAQLLYLSKLVKSGDSTNIESQAAKLYFTALFGNEFTRREDNGVNSCLNYGFAIIRAEIARMISAYGFIPSIGIKHKNEYNNFNLADDLIEPYRPFVEQWVANNVTNESKLDTKTKKELLNLLNVEVNMQNKKYEISYAIEKTVISLVDCINNQSSSLIILPRLT